MIRPTSIPADLWDDIPPTLRPAIAAVVAELEARIAELEARLAQNSSNSHRPPSSDGPHVKPAPPRKPSGKRRGGQAGHPKHERVLLPPDRTLDRKPTRCRRCCATLAGDDPSPIVDQVVDLPEKLRYVTHYRRHRLQCPHCRAITTATPVAEARTGFGPRITAATAYLTGACRLGKRTFRTLFGDLCGIPMSAGSVCKLERKASVALKPIHEEALQYTRGKDANVDETGWRQGAKKAWLWVAVTRLVTAFLIRPNRNREAFDDLVGPTPGVLTTDRYSVYAHLPGERRQICWAHLRRDFQAMVDRRNAGSDIGESLLAHADILFEQWRKVRDGTRTRRWFARTHAGWLREEVRLLLERGRACPCAKTAAACREVAAVEASLWTFARVSGVEPTNNAAERAVRHAVCWRKTSYGTDGERGSRFVERMLTAVSSCRQQGRGVLDFLVQAITGAKPSLLPEGA